MLTDLFKKPARKRHINPRIRAYGKARIDIARRATSLEEWDLLWKEPSNPFPFNWGERWKQCVEYKVDDFAAEVGFYIDLLGLPVNAFDPDYAMFTSPGGEFYLAVVPTPAGGKSTPAEAMRIQFMVADLLKTARELERRGITFDQSPQPCSPGSSMCIACFRTPNGISIDLWGHADSGELESILAEKQSDEYTDDFEEQPAEDALGSADLTGPEFINDQIDRDIEAARGARTTVAGHSKSASSKAKKMADRVYYLESSASTEAMQAEDNQDVEAEPDNPLGSSSLDRQLHFMVNEQFEEYEGREDDSSEDSIEDSNKTSRKDFSDEVVDEFGEEFDEDIGDDIGETVAEDFDEKTNDGIDEEDTFYEFTYDDDL